MLHSTGSKHETKTNIINQPFLKIIVDDVQTGWNQQDNDDFTWKTDKQLQNLAQILNLIADNEYNRVKLAALTGLSVESVKKYIAILIDFGLIEFVGAVKNGYYQIKQFNKHEFINWGKND